MQTCKKTILEAWHLLRRCLKQLFIAHLVFIALGIIIFGPLAGLLGQFVLYLSGQDVLADMDILYFLLTPFGVGAVILFCALMIMIVTLEAATMMIVCSANLAGRNVSTLSSLYTAAAKGLNIGSFSIRLVLRLLLIILPFLAAAGILAKLLISDHDINYYLSTTPPVFIAAAVIIGFLLLLMTFILIRKLISWSLALPLILFTNFSPAQSFNQSRQLISGHRQLVFKVFSLWTGLIFALTTAIFTVIQFTGSYFVTFFYDSIHLMIPFLGGLAIIFFVTNLLVTALTSGGFASLLTILFSTFSPDTRMDIVGSSDQTAHVQGKMPGLTALLAAGVIVSIFAGKWLLNDLQSEDNVAIIAHRGAAGKAPENTVAAVKQAIKDGADWVEIDVQESKDGEVIVIHDGDFMKIAGNNLRVSEGTLEQIKEIDIGSWFAPEFSGERTPTLKEILEIVRGKAGLIIELKYYGQDQQLEQRVVNTIKEAGSIDKFSIMSLKSKGVAKIRSIQPDWTTGLLAAKAFGNLSAIDVDYLAVNMGMATSSFIKQSHSAGKQVFVWTVNDPVSMSKMISKGIDGLITDEPEMARELLHERSKMSSVERLLIHTAVILNQPVPVKTYRDQSP